LRKLQRLPYKIYYQTPESSDDRALVAANFVLEETSKDARVRNAGKGTPAPWGTNKNHTAINHLARSLRLQNKTNYLTKESGDDREAVVAFSTMPASETREKDSRRLTEPTSTTSSNL